ncbi:MAG: hypothetical protein HS108_03770 [Planctomycetes bacterium]|jgi:hypothetical protein|nr:hypothetical protein [Planctomycetota bacterium]MCL4730054.1 hypothetical protein [Planctomycetota bacterium]
MRISALFALVFCFVMLAGCGGMPKPQIDATMPRSDATNVRASVMATNYDSSWDKENVRLRVHQIWLNRDGVPTNKETVLDKAFDGRQGDQRAVLKMKDSEGRSSNRVRLQFELVSGENKTNENVSAASTLEWKLSSSLANKDLLLLAVVSRKGRNNYALDVLYALDPATGYIEQVLPSYDAK